MEVEEEAIEVMVIETKAMGEAVEAMVEGAEVVLVVIEVVEVVIVGVDEHQEVAEVVSVEVHLQLLPKDQVSCWAPLGLL